MKKATINKIHITFIVLMFSTFFIVVFLKDKKGGERWLNTEIHGTVTDIAVKQKDKYTFFKLDSTWFWIGSRNPIFEEICYLDYTFIKRKGEEEIWLKNKINPNDSVSYWVHGAGKIEKKNEIYWIERERIIWSK